MNPTDADNPTPAQPPRSRADISRANGARSHGPVTPEGKARSSLNATRYGAFAKTVILPGEDPAEFETILQAHFHRFQPADEVEGDLVQVLVMCQWLRRRMWRAETTAITRQMDSCSRYVDNWNQKTGEEHVSHGMHGTLIDLKYIDRKLSHLTRDYDRALKTLLTLQKCKNEPSLGANPKETNEQPKLSAPPLATSHSSLATDNCSSLATSLPTGRPIGYNENGACGESAKADFFVAL